jgi:hypothetical protein
MVEARDDGRLAAAQGAELTRHAAGCGSCRQALAEADRLRSILDGAAEPVMTDLQHRRERQRLLAAAGRIMFDRGSRPTGHLRLAFSLVALAILASGAVVLRTIGSRHPAAPVAAAPVPPRYEVTPLNEASWVNQETGGTALVTLSRGSAAFHVHHLEAGQRFLVALPDGEIEVRGTRFVVDIEGGATRYVVVMEGKVAFRRPGQSEQLLIAGQRWDAPPPATAAPAVEPSIDRAAVKVPSASVRGTTSAPAARGPRATLASRPPVEAPTSHAPVVTPPSRNAPVTTSEASLLFAHGVAALRAGRYAEADEAWQEFLAKHPTDPRAEDATFLRAVGRERSGDRHGAAALARTYLERFPRGMRRREAETLSRDAP